MNTVKIYAPATIGNVGPGFDVLGLAIKGMGDTIEATKIEGQDVIIDAIHNADSDISTDPAKNTAGIAAREAMNLLGIEEGVRLSIYKGLPSGGGLGSSAASAAGGAYAVHALFGKSLSNDQILQAAMAGESSVSGGYFADNVAPAIFGGATLTQSLDPLEITPLGTISELIIILAIPKVQVLTRESRKVIPNQVELSDCIHNMANTASITAAFSKNDYSLIKNNLYDYIIEPRRAKLIPGFSSVKEATLDAGADGMTISGSGPTVFAITNKENRAQAIESAMANAFADHGVECRTLITTPSETGTRII